MIKAFYSIIIALGFSLTVSQVSLASENDEFGEEDFSELGPRKDTYLQVNYQ